MAKTAIAIRDQRAALLRGDKAGMEAALKRAYQPALVSGTIAYRLGLVSCTIAAPGKP
jgi:hypothetical protein